MPMASPSHTPNPNNLSTSSSFSFLIDRCLSFSSLPSGRAIHACLLKLGLHRNTFLGNRLLHLYSRLGILLSVLRAFNDIPAKNIFTWNILLSALSNAGCTIEARKVFDEMPERDIVSWNSIMSCYAGTGLFDAAFAAFYAMRELGLRVLWLEILLSKCMKGPALLTMPTRCSGDWRIQMPFHGTP